jgi:hypothetical protein
MTSTMLSAPPSAPGGELPISDSPARSRARNRPALVAGILLVLLGALGGWALVGSAGDRSDILAVARDVPIGAVLQASDLRVVALSDSPGLSPVPASEVDSIVGQRAAVSLTAGTVLTRAQVTGAPTLEDGRDLVALEVARGMGPVSALDIGDTVAAVPVSAQGQEPAVAERPITGTVAEIGRVNGNGAVVVHLLVAETESAQLATWAGGGKVSLVLTGKS